MEQIPSRSQ